VVVVATVEVVAELAIVSILYGDENVKNADL